MWSESTKDLIQNHLPTRRQEDWKYADISFLKKQDHVPFVLEKENEVEFNEKNKTLVIRLSNTLLNAKIKTLGKWPPGIKILSASDFNKTDLASSLASFASYKNYFVDLAQTLNNNAFFVVVSKEFPSDVLIEVQMGVDLPQSSQARFYNCKLNFVFEAFAKATVLERISLKANYFVLSGVDYYLQDTAQVTTLKLENGETGARGGHTQRLSLNKNATAHVTTVTQNSDWSRHNGYSQLVGENASVTLEAAFLTKDTQFVDHHTIIDHKVGHTTSVQKYNGVLSDKSKGVFNGKVIIDRDAQKSSAVQLNRNLLMSKQAEINTKPELQIDADDVQAKHGATVGQLSSEQLFYLLSRGISEPVARAMLMRGFVEEIGLDLPEVLQKIFFNEISDVF